MTYYLGGWVYMGFYRLSGASSILLLYYPELTMDIPGKVRLSPFELQPHGYGPVMSLSLVENQLLWIYMHPTILVI